MENPGFVGKTGKNPIAMLTSRRLRTVVVLDCLPLSRRSVYRRVPFNLRPILACEPLPDCPFLHILYVTVSRVNQGGKRDNQDGKFFEGAISEAFSSDLTALEAI